VALECTLGPHLEERMGWVWWSGGVADPLRMTAPEAIPNMIRQASRASLRNVRLTALRRAA